MKTLVFNLTNRGTYSEINNWIIAKAYANRIGASLLVDDRAWSGGAIDGICDYFKVDPDELRRDGPVLRSLFSNTANGKSLLENRISKLQ